MEWEKAKNIILFALIGINIVLGTLVYMNSRKYILSGEDEKTITNILERNEIAFYTDLVKDYSPKKVLGVKSFNFRHSDIVSGLFNNPNDTVITRENNTTIFKNEEGTLYFYGDGNEFEFFSLRNESFQVTEENAKLESEKIIKKLSPEFNRFTLDSVTFWEPSEDNSGKTISLYYRDTFDGYILNSNYIYLTFDSNGLRQLSVEYFKPVGFTSDGKKEIFSSDKILITFMKDIVNSDYEYDNIIINRMDLVYNIDLKEDGNYEMVPFYRIFILEREEPFLINAYHNIMESEAL